MYSADVLFYDVKDDQRVFPILEIPQKAVHKEDEVDIYFGDNKLVELVTS